MTRLRIESEACAGRGVANKDGDPLVLAIRGQLPILRNCLGDEKGPWLGEQYGRSLVARVLTAHSRSRLCFAGVRGLRVT